MKHPTKIQEWRPTPDFSGYEVSNWGRVRRWYVDSEGVDFHHNLKIHGRDKTVGLEREKGSGKYVGATSLASCSRRSRPKARSRAPGVAISARGGSLLSALTALQDA